PSDPRAALQTLRCLPRSCGARRRDHQAATARVPNGAKPSELRLAASPFAAPPFVSEASLLYPADRVRAVRLARCSWRPAARTRSLGKIAFGGSRRLLEGRVPRRPHRRQAFAHAPYG